MNGKYKIEKENKNNIEEIYFDDAETAIFEAECILNRMSGYDRRWNTVNVYRVENETYNGEEFENLFEIWSSSIEGCIIGRSVDNAMLTIEKGGKITMIPYGIDEWFEPSALFERVREEHKNGARIHVEFFKDHKTDDGFLTVKELELL